MTQDEFVAMAKKLIVEFKGGVTDEEIEAIRRRQGWILCRACKQIMIRMLHEDRWDYATDEEAAFMLEANKARDQWCKETGLEKPARFPRVLRKKAERWERRRRMQ